MIDPESQLQAPKVHAQWFHLQHARWALNPCSLRDTIDDVIYNRFGQNEVPGVSKLAACREVMGHD